LARCSACDVHIAAIVWRHTQASSYSPVLVVAATRGRAWTAQPEAALGDKHVCDVLATQVRLLTLVRPTWSVSVPVPFRRLGVSAPCGFTPARWPLGIWRRVGTPLGGLRGRMFYGEPCLSSKWLPRRHTTGNRTFLSFSRADRNCFGLTRGHITGYTQLAYASGPFRFAYSNLH